MDKVFLDTNYLIGLVNGIPETDVTLLNQRHGYVSVLSCHILFYVNKIKVPDKKVNSFLKDFNLVGLENDMLQKALIGPTKDLEDNIQLHSAAIADCNFFLTNDKALLKMKFFGKAEITNTLSRA